MKSSDHRERIELCERYKKQIYDNIGQIDRADEWIKYYNDYIDYCESEIKKKKIITAVIPFVLIALFLFYFNFEAEITTIIGLVPYEANETEENITIEDEEIIENVTEEINITEEVTENITEEEIIENITELNITELEFNITEINITENITIEFNITEGIIEENITEIVNITEEVNVTEINVTEEIIEEKIIINFEYKAGTLFDQDNNGIANLTDIVDFTVENTQYNVNEDNLCTRYSVESLDNLTKSFVCYGNQECCNFVELIPILDNWNDPLNVYVKRYDAGLDNIVSAQVLFYNFTDIYYSNWSSLTAKFMENVTENITIPEIPEINITANITIVNKTIKQFGAVIGKSVKWQKRIKYSNLTKANVSIPKEVINFSIKKIIDGKEIEIDEDKIKIKKDNLIKTIDEYELDQITGYSVRITDGVGLFSRFLNLLFNFFYNVFNTITGYVTGAPEESNEAEIIIEEEVEEIEIEYYTDAPTAVEEVIPTGKKITVSAELNYTDVLTFTSISETPAEAIKLYWYATEEDYKKYFGDEEIMFSGLDNEKKENKSHNKVITVEPSERLSFDSVDNNNIYKSFDENKKKKEKSGSIKLVDFVPQITNTSNSEYINISFLNNQECRAADDQAGRSLVLRTSVCSTDMRVQNSQFIESPVRGAQNIFNILPSVSAAPLEVKKYKIDVTEDPRFAVSFIDSNNDGLVDMIYWLTPHTSDQEFEITLTILTLKSNPQLGSNWTVSFETTGIANLTITAVQGTSFEEDIVFKEIRCGDELVDADYNGERVFVEDYSCSDIGKHEVTVLTFGHHYQEFNFGGITGIAENAVYGCKDGHCIDDNQTDWNAGTFVNMTSEGENLTLNITDCPTGHISLGGITCAANYTAISTATGQQETYVRSDDVNTNFDGTSWRWGYVDHHDKALLQFQDYILSEIQDNASAIISAYVRVYDKEAANPETYSVKRIAQSWDETTVTYTSQPSTAGPVSDTVTITAGWYGFDVTEIFRGFFNGTWTDYGYFFEDTTSTARSLMIPADDGANPTLHPQFNVTYNKSGYNSIGFFTSQVFNAESSVTWDNISWSKNIPDSAEDYENQTDGWHLDNIDSNMDQSHGITTNGTDFWITELTLDYMWHVNSTGQNDTGGLSLKTIDSAIDRAYGIVYNGTDWWVYGSTNQYVYHINSDYQNASRGGFTTSGEIATMEGVGMTSNGTDFWICDYNDGIRHYRGDGTYVGIHTVSGMSYYYGITTDGTDFWVGDADGDSNIYHTDNSFNVKKIIDGSEFGIANTGALTTNCMFPKDEGSCDVTDLWITDTATLEFVFHLEKTNLRFQARTTDSEGTTGDWVGDDNTSSTYFTSTGDLSDLTTGQYFQYKAFLETSNTSLTPYLEWVNVSYTSAAAPDTTAPQIFLDNPSNGTQLFISDFINITVNDSTAVSKVWYSVDSGNNNITMLNLSQKYFLNVTEFPYQNNLDVYFYFNDSEGNANSTIFRFNITGLNITIDSLSSVTTSSTFYVSGHVNLSNGTNISSETIYVWVNGSLQSVASGTSVDDAQADWNAGTFVNTTNELSDGNLTLNDTLGGVNTASDTLDSDYGTISSHRMVVAKREIKYSGRRVRIRAVTSSSAAATDSMYSICINHTSGGSCKPGTLANFTFRGNIIAGIPAGGTNWSDWIDYGFNDSNNYLIGFYGTNSRYHNVNPHIGRWVKAANIFNDEDWSDDSPTGPHESTWLGFDAIQVQLYAENGTFTSQVFDAESSVTWDNISWSKHYGELPDDQYNDSTSFPAYMDGNIILWHLDNESNGTQTYDSSGHSQVGRTFNAGYNTTNYKFGKALTFSGTGCTVTPVNAITESDIAGGGTMSGWFYPTKTPDDQDRFISVEDRWMIWENRDSVNYWSAYAYDGSEAIVDSLSTITVGAWTHVVNVFNTTHILLYVNGVFQSAATSGTPTIDGVSRPFGIAGYPEAYALCSSGLTDAVFDEVAVWNRSLSSTEINDLYERQLHDLKFQVRTTDSGGSTGDWVGYDNTSSSYFTSGGNYSGVYGNFSGNLEGQYFQYKAYLETSNTSLTPYLEWVNVSYTGSSTTSGTTDSGGNYNKSATAPDEDGTYEVRVNLTYNPDFWMNASLVVGEAEEEDSTSPYWFYGSNLTNFTTIRVNENGQFMINYTDETALDTIILSWKNHTASWTNITTQRVSGKNYNVTFNMTINTTRHQIQYWKFYANDTTGNWNESDLFQINVSDTVPTTPSTPTTTTDGVPGNYTNVTITSSVGTGSIDADADSITYYYRWDDGSVLQEVAHPTVTLDCDSVSGCDRGDTITVKIIATTPWGNSSASSASGQTIILDYHAIWQKNGTNFTSIKVNENGMFNVTVKDIDTLDSAIFSLKNSSGADWYNYSALRISGESYELKYNITISSNVTQVLSWRYYFNDSVGTMYNSSVNNIIISDTYATWTKNGTNFSSIQQNENGMFNVTVNDADGLDRCIFSLKNDSSASWYNYSALEVSGTSYELKYNVTISTSALQTLSWRYYCNDSSGTMYNSSINNIDVTDTIDPTITLINPPDTDTDNNLTQTFVFQSNENSNCTLWHNLSETFEMNQTWYNISADTNVIMTVNMNTGNVYENIVWNVNCSDASANDVFASSNFTYYYDNINPVLTFTTPSSNNQTIAGTTLNLNLECSDSNGLWESSVNITLDGVNKFSKGNISRLNTSHKFTDSIDISSWTSANHTLAFECSDTHTYGLEDKLKKGKKGETILFFNDTKSKLDISMYFVEKNDKSTDTPGDVKSNIDFINNQYKFGINFTVLKPETKIIFNLSSDEILHYLPQSPYKAHFIWGDYFVEFDSARTVKVNGIEKETNITVTKNGNDYLVKIEGVEQWQGNDFIEIDPIIDGLNIVRENITFVVDNTKPSWKYNRTNFTSIIINENGQFNITAEDETSLDTIIFSRLESGGSWTNETTQRISGKSYDGAFNYTVTSGEGQTFQWKFYINDSAGNWNETDLFSVVLSSVNPSIILVNQTNNSQIFYTNKIYWNITDNIAVSKGWWSKDSGTTNYTFYNSSTIYELNTTDWKFNRTTIYLWANDTSGNVNETRFTFNVTGVNITIDSLSSVTASSEFYITGHVNLSNGTDITDDVTVYVNGSLQSTKTYDFSDTSDKLAYEKGGALPISPGDYDSIASSGDYTNIESSNNNRWTTASASVEQYDSQIYLFNVTENIGNIKAINITWEGYGDTNEDYLTNLSIWNWASGKWVDLANKDFTSAADDTLLGSLSSGFSNYVNSTTKQIAVLITTIKTTSLGESCSLDSDCGSGNCVESVCCNTACDSTCQSCLAAYTGGSDGTCGNIVVNTDPYNECSVANCFTGNCDGSGACKIYSSNEEGQCGTCYECSDADSACDPISSGQEDSTGSNTCSAVCTQCNGAGGCVNIADHNQDTAGTNTCTATCKECDGEGSCANQDAAQDYFSQCTQTYSCDGFTTRLRNMCDGSGSCDDIDAAASDCTGKCNNYCSAGSCVNTDTNSGTCIIATDVRVASGGDGGCTSGNCVAKTTCGAFLSRYYCRTPFIDSATWVDEDTCRTFCEGLEASCARYVTGPQSDCMCYSGPREYGGGWASHENCASCSSPYIYIFNEDYEFISDFIAGATSKEREYISFTELPITNNKIKLKITEELDETAYLDNYYLKIFNYKDEDEFNDYFNKNFIKINYNNWKQIGFEEHNIIEYNINALQQSELTLYSDNNYLIMEKGFEKELEFNVPELKNKYKIFFVAEGYYIEHDTIELNEINELNNEVNIKKLEDEIITELNNKNKENKKRTHRSLYTDYIKIEIISGTDSSGDYNVTATAPSEPGTYEVLVNLTYQSVDFRNNASLIVEEITTFSQNGTNFTTIKSKENAMFNITANDENNLHSAIFSLKNSTNDAWYNYSALRISGTSYELRYNVTISSYNGQTINWRYYANDSNGVMYASDIHSFVISDTYSTWSKNGTNFTSIKVNENGMFNVTVNDNDDLDRCIFSLKNSSNNNWYNYSALNISGTSYELRYNITISSINNDILSWRYYCNDSSGKMYNSSVNNIIISDTVMNFTQNGTNFTSIKSKENAMFNITATDPDGLEMYIFSMKNSSSANWYNYSAVSITGNTSYFINTTHKISSYNGQTVQWRYYVNDSSEVMNDSGIHYFTINETYMTWANNGTNFTSIKTNNNGMFNVTVNDADGLDRCMFSLRNKSGESWYNYSALDVSGTNSKLKYNLTISTKYNYTLSWRYYCNDSSGVMYNSSVNNITISDTAPTTPTWIAPTPNNDSSFGLNKTLNYTSTDADNNLITYYLYFDKNNPPITPVINNLTESNWTMNLTSDGIYYYRVLASDRTLNSSFTEIRTYRYDTTSLIGVNISSPTNDSTTTDPTPTIYFNITDVLSDLINYTVHLNGTGINKRGQTTNGTDSNVTLNQLPALGEYLITIEAEDEAGNKKNSSIWYLTLGPPNVYLMYPGVDQYIDNYTVRFRFNVTDAQYDTLNCSLYIDDVYNYTMNSTANTEVNFTDINLTEKNNWLWNVSCENPAGSIGEDIRLFSIDLTDPSVGLESPQNNSWNTNGSIMFRYTPDDLNIDYCILNHNQSTFIGNVTNTSLSSGTQVNVLIDLPEGNYVWNVNCSDKAKNNAFNTTNYTIYIDTIYPSIKLTNQTNNTVFNSGTTIYLTISDTNLDSIWYSNNSGTNNYSLSIYDIDTTNYVSQKFDFYVWANDSARNINETKFTFTIDDGNPSVALVLPSNNTFDNDGIIQFNGTCVDSNPANTTLYGNWTGTWKDNQTIIYTSGEEFNLTKFSLAEGNYEWNVFCNDSAGNNASNGTNFIFTVDTTNPNIALNLANNTYDSDGDILFQYTGTDIHLDSCTLWHNSSGWSANETNRTSIGLTSGTQANISLNLTDGNYEWNVFCNDSAANNISNGTNYILVVDTINPGVNFTLSTEENNSYFNRDYVYINVTIDDVNFKNITISLYNSTDLVSNYTNTTNGNNYYYNFTSLVNTDETYYYNATIYDKAENSNTTETRIIILDNVNPNITLTSPANNSWNNNGSVMFRYTPIDKNIKNCTIYHNQSEFSANVTNTSLTNGTEVKVLINFPDGNYIWGVKCYDFANNVFNSTNYTFKVDDTDISIALNLENNTYDSDGDILFQYTGTDSYLDSCTLWHNSSGWSANETNRTSIGLTSGTQANISLNLTDGNYEWNVFCNDSAANNISNGTNYILTVDSIYPGINYTKLTENNNTYFNRDYIYVNVSVDETNFANITFTLWNSTNRINETNFTTSTTELNFTGIEDTNDEYWYNVTIEDKANHSNTTEIRKITLDSTNPLINFTATTENNYTYFNRSYIFVNITANDTNFKNITISLYNSTDLINNYTNITYDKNAYYFYNFTLLSNTDETYYYNATIYDKAENKNTTETRILTLDNTDPMALSAYPANNSFTNNKEIFFTIMCIDTNPENATLYGNWSGTWTSNYTGSYTSSTEFNLTIFNLSDGNYLWNVYCNDSAGNGDFDYYNYSFVVDTTNVSIALNLANNTYDSDGDILFQYTATDLYLDSCTLWHNSSGWGANETNRTNVGLTSGTQASINLNLDDGNYEWNVFCNDSAGNNVSNGTNFILISDTTYPGINYTLSTKNNNTYFNGTYIFVNVSVDETNFANLTFNLWNRTKQVNTTTVTSSLREVNWTSLVTDTKYWYNVTVEDKAKNSNTTEIRKLTLDSTPPIAVNISSPSNDSSLSDSTPTIYFNITDALGETLNYTVHLNGTGINKRGQTTNGTDSNVTLNQLPALGEYLITIEAEDEAGNKKNSSILYLTLGPPAVYLMYPGVDQYIDNFTVRFRFNVTDLTYSSVNCSLYIDNIYNYTMNSTVDTEVNFTDINLTEKNNWKWNVTCENPVGNIGSDSRLFSIDLTNPSVSLNNPLNNSWSSSSSPVFGGTCIDTNPYYAYLYTNQTTWNNNASTTYTNDTAFNFSSLNFADGNYLWNIKCDDKAGRNNYSEFNYTIHIDTTYPGINLTSSTENNNTYFNRTWIYINVTIDDINFANITYTLWNTTRQVNKTTYSSLITSINFTTGLNPDEQYWYNVTVVDKARNSNTTEIRKLTLDNTLPVIIWTIPSNDNTSIFNATFSQNVTFNDTNLYMFNCTIYSDSSLTINVWSVEKNLGTNTTFTKNDSVDIGEFSDGIYYERCIVSDKN